MSYVVSMQRVDSNTHPQNIHMKKVKEHFKPRGGGGGNLGVILVRVCGPVF